jgi:hypothetical protein
VCVRVPFSVFRYVLGLFFICVFVPPRKPLSTLLLTCRACVLVCAQEIDAYWLQRRIGRAYGDTIDAPRAQQLAEEVLTTLASPADSRTLVSGKCFRLQRRERVASKVNPVCQTA